MTTMRMPRVIRCPSAERVHELTAMRIFQLVELLPQPLIGVAADEPLGPAYDRLVRQAKRKEIDTSGVMMFNAYELLDERGALMESGDPRSARGRLDARLFGPLGISDSMVFGPEPDGEPDSTAGTPVHRRYAGLIESLGGLDLQVLAMGDDGAIALNRPIDCDINSRTRVVKHSSNSSAITVGMRDLTDLTRELWITVTGSAAAKSLATALGASPTTACPASFFRPRYHPNVTFVVDEASYALVGACPHTADRRNQVH